MLGIAYLDGLMGFTGEWPTELVVMYKYYNLREKGVWLTKFDDPL